MAEPGDLRNAVNHALLILKNKPAPPNADLRGAAQLVVGLMGGDGRYAGNHCAVSKPGGVVQTIRATGSERTSTGVAVAEDQSSCLVFGLRTKTQVRHFVNRKQVTLCVMSFNDGIDQLAI